MMIKIFAVSFFITTNFLSLSTPFTLHTSSACLAKSFNSLFFNFSSTSSHPLQLDDSNCGEDGFLITQNRHLKLLTVADGAGGWRYKGINVKFFVTELLELFKGKYENLTFEHVKFHDSMQKVIPKLFNQSIEVLKAREENVNFRSCTMVSISINLKTLMANYYYLGDAGFSIIRNGKVKFISVDQMNGFNKPYLMGFGGRTQGIDFGDFKKIKLRANDVIILYSDGVSDNLYEQRILEIVNEESFLKLRSEKVDYQEIADNIARKMIIEAKRIGEFKFGVRTPYGDEIKQYFKEKYRGGKKDDTTVVVGIIGL